MSRKVYVEVAAVFTPEGHVLPTQIRWENGTVSPIDRVTDIRRAAAPKPADMDFDTPSASADSRPFCS